MLGNNKLNNAKGRVKISSAALKYNFLAKQISFVKLFFFEAMTIIQI